MRRLQVIARHALRTFASNYAALANCICAVPVFAAAVGIRCESFCKAVSTKAAGEVGQSNTDFQAATAVRALSVKFIANNFDGLFSAENNRHLGGSRLRAASSPPVLLVDEDNMSQIRDGVKP
jgi:hypothetical protein